MLRLAHRILSNPPKIGLSSEEQRERWSPYLIPQLAYCTRAIADPQTVVISADNVAEYYGASQQMEWDIEKDFPCVAPPFQRFFIEWRFPSYAIATSYGGGGTTVMTREESPISQMGWLITSMPVEETPGFPEFENVHNSAKEDVRQCASKSKWSFLCHPFCALKRDGSTFYFGSTVQIFVGPTGQVVGRVAFPGPLLADQTNELLDEMNVPLLTLSFLHCKNVSRIDSSIAMNPEDKWIRRAKIPRLKYYTLDIEPMKQVLKTEGNVEAIGLPKALHICRGHFATYTDAAPLFGRITGRFWKAQHVRGSAKEGIVVKDYAVKAPAQLTPE